MPAKQERHFVVLLRKVFHGLSGYAVSGSQFARGVIMAHLINHQTLRGEPETCIHWEERSAKSHKCAMRRRKELAAIVGCRERACAPQDTSAMQSMQTARHDCATLESYAELQVTATTCFDMQ